VLKRKNNMPFLDPEELKPKLKEIFETVVIPQIKRANMKQTAVGWFYEKLVVGKLTGKDTIDFLYETAKQMEKEQIKQSFVECWKANVPDGIECKLDAEQYYNETFKSE